MRRQQDRKAVQGVGHERVFVRKPVKSQGFSLDPEVKCMESQRGEVNR